MSIHEPLIQIKTIDNQLIELNPKILQFCQFEIKQRRGPKSKSQVQVFNSQLELKKIEQIVAYFESNAYNPVVYSF